MIRGKEMRRVTTGYYIAISNTKTIICISSKAMTDSHNHSYNRYKVVLLVLIFKTVKSNYHKLHGKYRACKDLDTVSGDVNNLSWTNFRNVIMFAEIC